MHQAVGVQLRTTAAATIRAIRFLKAAFEGGGPHTGLVYDNSTGAVLATTGAFTDGSCGGRVWVSAPLTAPLAIRPGVVYVVAVDGVLHFPSTPEFLMRSARTSGILVALHHGSVAGPAGTVPRTNLRDKNYWVDVELA